MNKDQIQLAINTGLNLFGKDSDTTVPIKDLDGLVYLRRLLVAIANGEVALTANPDVKPTPQPPANPTPKGPPAKKRSKKK